MRQEGRKEIVVEGMPLSDEWYAGVRVVVMSVLPKWN